MATTQKIQSLINDIQKNRYFLPEFQWDFRWNLEQVKKYFQSLYRGYPTGAFLVWKAEIVSKIKGSTPREETPIRIGRPQFLNALQSGENISCRQHSF